jgi:exodeoxyribonuclease-5
MSQKILLEKLAAFLANNSQRKSFLLQGYAGTGKTTSIQALIKTLAAIDYKPVLLAPTGRAAKVITQYTHVDASTIHRYLYEIKTAKDGNVNVRIRENKIPRRVFIVDEASMISNEDDKTLFHGSSLLADLIDHVYSIKECCLVFIGDTAQLPPVGIAISPALDENYLSRNFNLEVYTHELNEVVRQQLESGILANAHCTRLLIQRNELFPRLKEKGFQDVVKAEQSDLSDLLSNYLPQRTEGQVTVICRSNKQANKYNAYIRKRFYEFEEQIEKNDLLMVVKNNYHWHESDDKNAFIANGDSVTLIKITNREECFGFQFADAIIELQDFVSTRLSVKLILNSLTSETPSLSYDEYKLLFDAVKKDYVQKHGKVNMRKLKEDPYLNALQVKYAYAITCHKAQGGQWETVFVDPGFMTEEMYNKEYLRWLYTALTRARKKVYLVNMPQQFFVE